jgi:hypothetical protein
MAAVAGDLFQAMLRAFAPRAAKDSAFFHQTAAGLMAALLRFCRHRSPSGSFDAKCTTPESGSHFAKFPIGATTLFMQESDLHV